MKEWSWMEKGGKERTGGKRGGLDERAIGGQVVWRGRDGGHVGRREGRDGNKRGKKRREMQKGTEISPTFDTSSPATHKHIHTLTRTRDTELVLERSSAARSMPLDISKERDSNTRGPRRSP